MQSALLIDETLDAATPYEGSLQVRKLYPNSSLIALPGGTSHANSLSGDACLDDQIADYLATGKLPARKPGNGAGHDVRAATRAGARCRSEQRSQDGRQFAGGRRRGGQGIAPAGPVAASTAGITDFRGARRRMCAATRRYRRGRRPRCGRLSVREVRDQVDAEDHGRAARRLDGQAPGVTATRSASRPTPRPMPASGSAAVSGGSESREGTGLERALREQQADHRRDHDADTSTRCRTVDDMPCSARSSD